MRKLFLIALLSVNPLIGCGLDQLSDKQDVLNYSNVNVATFTWNDDSRTYEKTRTLNQSADGKYQTAEQAIAFAKIPNELRILIPLTPDASLCQAEIWPDGLKLVRTECVRVPGTPEVVIKGSSGVIPAFKHGAHKLHVTVGGSNFNFTIHTLPNGIQIQSTPEEVGVLKIDAVSAIHRIGTLSIKVPTAEGLRLKIPTKINGIVIRKFTRYFSESTGCDIWQRSEPVEEQIPVEIKLVEDRPGVERDWPERFSKDSNNIQLETSGMTKLALYASTPYLNGFYSPGFVLESPQVNKIHSSCMSIGDPGMRRYRDEISADRTIGRAESQPLVRFSIDKIKATDVTEENETSNQISSEIEKVSFEFLLSQGAR